MSNHLCRGEMTRFAKARSAQQQRLCSENRSGRCAAPLGATSTDRSLALHRRVSAHTESPKPVRPRPEHTKPDPTRPDSTHLLLHQLHLRKPPILGPRRPALSPIPINVQREEVARARVAVGVPVCRGSAGFALPIRGEARARPAGLGEEQRVCAVSGVALAPGHLERNGFAVADYGRDDA